MATDAELRSGTASPEGLRALEQRVQALEASYLPDNGAITNNYTVNENGEVEVIESGGGAEILEGEGEPEEALGAEGDLYVDSLTKLIYKKGAGGWSALSGGTPGAYGSATVLETQWALGAGTTLAQLVPIAFSPVSALALVFSNYAGNALLPEYGKFTGQNIASGSFSRTGGNLAAAKLAPYVGALPSAPGNRMWRLTRTGEANEKVEHLLWLIMLATAGPIERTGSAVVERTIGQGTLAEIAVESAAPNTSTQVLFASFMRGSEALPTATSETAASSRLSTGNKGVLACGYQFYWPTAAEKAAGTKHKFTWNFANSGAEQETYARVDNYDLV